MNAKYAAISDFLDGEAFDPDALNDALADPAGRELLIDFVVLRYAARAEEPVSRLVTHPSRTRVVLAAAAALIVALVGGYQLGSRLADRDSPPPSATRVVQAPGWQTN
jgi:hypothetical protein